MSATSHTPSSSSATGLVYDPSYLNHDTGFGHPECAERLSAIMDRLNETGLLPALSRIQPVPAALEWIHAVHSPAYVERVKAACARGESFIDSLDCPVSPESYSAALLAAGGAMKAVDAVITGSVRNAFCAVRPPGHHAMNDRAMGFCLFNNVAIAARYAQKQYRLNRVLIVDWDVHHGNGTQDSFYDDPSILYYSSHRYPFYPGTGATVDQGTRSGHGATINAPLAMGSCDRDILDALTHKLLPRINDFRPDLVLISAGFDAHESDPLGGMAVTTEGFARMTRLVRGMAEKSCGGRLVSVLEGGYDLDGLASCVETHIRGLLGPADFFTRAEESR